MALKILICDDDEAVLSVVRFKLLKDNIGEVFTARDGDEAMKQLREQDFDLVITDIHMPYHDGGQVLNLIRDEQKKKTPIIMLSSDAEEEVIAMAKKQGVDEFIKKPLRSADYVASRVKKLLHLK
ncbi:MAG: response regulator [Bacteroidetes bacterium]|nr:response regulator [Bacteroidota bacterium]